MYWAAHLLEATQKQRKNSKEQKDRLEVLFVCVSHYQSSLVNNKLQNFQLLCLTVLQIPLKLLIFNS